MIPVVLSALVTVPKGLEKELEELDIRRTNGNHPNLTIVKIGQITEKSPGDLRRLVITQIPVKTISYFYVKDSEEMIKMITAIP